MKKTIKFMGLAAALLIMTFIAQSVASAETIELKMGHFMSPMHIQHQKSFIPFSQEVEKLTQGNVKIKIFPGGALGGALELADAVKTGIVDIAFIVPSYNTGRFPRISAFDLPFIFKNAVQTTEILYDVYEQYLAEDFKDYKVLWLYSCDTGQLHSVTKPIRKIEDLHGMKMRTPSSYMSEALRLLGVNPLSMPLSELAVSLDKHVIDGMLTPNTAVVDFKLASTIKYSAQIDFYVSPMAVVMNKEKFNALPDSAKKALEQASGKKWGLRAARLYDDYAQKTLKELGDSGKVKIFSLSAADRNKCIEKVKKMEVDWVAKNTAKGIPASELLTKIKTLSAQK